MEDIEMKRVQGDIPAELARQVRVIAANRDVTVPVILKEALEQYIKAEQQ